MKTTLLSLASLLWQPAQADQSFQQQCLAFAPQNSIANSSLVMLEYVSAGTNLSVPQDPTCGLQGWETIGFDFCRAVLHVPTSTRSSFTMELWLPSNWTGQRVLATGNGGIDGCLYYDNIKYAASNGFATVATNNGHNGTVGKDFLNNPDVIIDFAYRALHLATVYVKDLATSFYGKTYNKSYYLGCSLGGRQGFGAADRYPDDFDGVLAGSPAVDFDNLCAWRGHFYPITGKNTSANFINATKWAEINKEILNQCDTLDGVKDGIIEDPTLCQFRPETMLCDAPGVGCLTPAQVAIVNNVFSPMYSTAGTLLYPGPNPGSEVLASAGLYSGLAWPPSLGWYRYVLLNDSTWDPFTFNVTYATLADQINPSNIKTWPTNLTPFASKGGKLLTYHGQQDQQISSFQSPRMYNHIAAGMPTYKGNLDPFYRFFRISGMSHCLGGPGAYAFGQWGAQAAAGVAFEPDVNILAAMVEWVENGKAPETILGTKFVDDDPTQGVELQRRHCRYPMRNTYIGGNASWPGSWECREV